MALKKDELWKKHLDKHPDWVNEDKKIQLTVGMLRKLLEDSYDKGHARGREINDVFKDLVDSVRGSGGLGQFEVKVEGKDGKGPA